MSVAERMGRIIEYRVKDEDFIVMVGVYSSRVRFCNGMGDV